MCNDKWKLQQKESLKSLVLKLKLIMDRFSLLLLEPGEIYFEDFKVLKCFNWLNKELNFQFQVSAYLLKYIDVIKDGGKSFEYILLWPIRTAQKRGCQFHDLPFIV